MGWGLGLRGQICQLFFFLNAFDRNLIIFSLSIASIIAMNYLWFKLFLILSRPAYYYFYYYYWYSFKWVISVNIGFPSSLGKIFTTTWLGSSCLLRFFYLPCQGFLGSLPQSLLHRNRWPPPFQDEINIHFCESPLLYHLLKNFTLSITNISPWHSCPTVYLGLSLLEHFPLSTKRFKSFYFCSSWHTSSMTFMILKSSFHLCALSVSFTYILLILSLTPKFGPQHFLYSLEFLIW